jgi:hypothetical protein
MLTDVEPRPRAPGERAVSTLELSGTVALPRTVEAPSVDFFDVLARRRSRTGAATPVEQLASLLWHAMQLRERRFDGRFGLWESRTSPSAGGIHGIRLLVLPLEANEPAGVYDDVSHALGLCGCDPAAAKVLNGKSVADLTGATTGTTVQLLADPTLLAGCYENHETLLWRDAGAMIAILCLIAEALDLAAVPLGRCGTDIVRAFGLGNPFVGTGAVHLARQLR